MPLSVDYESPIDLEAIRAKLREIGQESVLQFEAKLAPEERERLIASIAGIDLDAVPGWLERYVKSKPSFAPPADLAPAPYYPADPKSPVRSWDRERYRAAGEKLLRAGAVSVFTVAGGQGTRLGYDGPKGCYPATPVTGKPLFRCVAEWILAAQRRYDCIIPWYIMTSEANHDVTLAFFRDQNWFGLEAHNVMLFKQGMMPTFDRETGDILLAARDRIATNPDGHGGSLRALYVTGALEDMKARGVKHLSYVQIDNPSVRVIDPVFIGLHAEADDSSGEMSSKMVAKRDASERVGVFCTGGGKLMIAEYSDLSAEMAAETDERGMLRYIAGSPAIHMISVDFVMRLNQKSDSGAALPFHRADKKTPFIDRKTGELVQPTEPNGVKLETFVFDALAECESSVLLETDRIEEFAPIKNAEGEDSAVTSAAIQTERAARWLEQAGVEIPRDAQGSPDCRLEISPLVAMSPRDLREMDLPKSIERGETFALTGD